MGGKIKSFLTDATRIVGRGLPRFVVAGLAVLSFGAYAGVAVGIRHAADPGDSPAPQPTFHVTVVRPAQRVKAGAAARYTIRIRRRQFGEAVSFALASHVPPGLGVRFSPRSTRGRRDTLIVRTSWRTGPRRYRLRVHAKAGGVTRTLTLTLTIVRPWSGASAAGGPVSFSISGNAAGPLEPGVPQALDLQITNPNSATLIVGDVAVAIVAIHAPHATATLPCSTGDFAVRQFTGPLPLVITASSTRDLAGLGIAPSLWPQVTLLDLPSNQDGCHGASTTLSYTASARLG